MKKNYDDESIKYVVLQEISDEEAECWLYFIKYNGNEEALEHLAKDLDSIEWELIEGQSAFDLDLKHFVSSKTAKEMTKVELNHYQWHRKFDGKLANIDFKFKKRDDMDEKMLKVNNILNYGQIDNYIEDEDIDTEDLTDNTDGTDDDTDDDFSSIGLSKDYKEE